MEATGLCGYDNLNGKSKNLFSGKSKSMKVIKKKLLLF